MILINDNEVMTSGRMSVNYSLVNPHLLYDNIPSSTAEIPGFPAGGLNRHIFQHWEDPQAGPVLPELNYKHFWGGELIKEGFLLLTEASEEGGYKGVYSDRLGVFFGDLQNVSMRQIDFGSITRAAVPYPWANDLDGDLMVCYPKISNDRFWGIGTTTFINNFQGLLSSFHYDSSPLVPCFSVIYALKKIAEKTGVRITGSFFSHPTWQKLILFNLAESRELNIRLQDHLPDMTIVDFLLELRKIANLKLTFNSVRKTLQLDFWEDDLRADFRIDWSKKATAGETKTPEQNNRLRLAMITDPEDAMAKENPTWFIPEIPLYTSLGEYISPFVSEPGGIADIPMKFSTLAKHTEYQVCFCNQEGQSNGNGFDTKKWSPRLLFWTGMEDGGTRPAATNFLDGISLTPAGLARTTWKETIAIRGRSFYLQKKVMLNEADIARLDFSKKYHIAGMDYLLAQVNVSVPVRGPAQALLIGGI